MYITLGRFFNAYKIACIPCTWSNGKIVIKKVKALPNRDLFQSET